MLPIEAVLPSLRTALRGREAAVLQAPPGAGKTTRVPLALLGEPWMASGKIVMLEPRRLAARAAARHMAATLGERVGETVGYRVRMDTQVGPRTRVEVVTEGVLTRMLLDDPSLEGIALLIFDEFHERSLVSDLGLALALQTRDVLRDDLRLLVMSATIDGAAVAALVGEAQRGPAPLVTSEGRGFPVDTRYAPRRPEGRVEPAVAAATRAAVAADDGDVLVFLPGAAEIRRVAGMLDGALPRGVRVAPLYGNLPQEEQDRAIAPSEPGSRKVVLATSIAETSLTIEGVRVVVDSGLSRVPRFSPRTGMTRLETVRVSRAAADQRRGRAGRTAPGVCHRLWPEQEHHHLVAHDSPEIVEADLAPLALDLAAAGVSDPAELRWLDAPPAAAFEQARALLAQLGALDAAGRITERGRRMSRLGTHPRLAHMLVEAKDAGLGAVACDLAALLDERDVLRGEGGPPPDVDLRLRLELLRDADRGAAPTLVHGASVDRDALRRVRAESRERRRALGVRADAPADGVDACGLLLAYAYPDRIAQRRPGQAARYVMRNGWGALLPEGQQGLAAAPFIVAAELDGRRPESRVYLAAPLEEAELESHFADQIVREDVVEWDGETRSVTARRRERLGAIVLRDAALRDPDPEAVARALLDGIARDGIDVIPWSDAARRVQQRVAFLRRLEPARWPDLSSEHLAATLDQWLAPHLHGVRRRADVARLDLSAILLGALGWEQRAALDELAPTHLVVPTGSRLPVDYSDPASPVLAVRLQELFGLADTPRLARGAVPVTLHLLSPAHRPVQVTRDLAGFWRGSYFDVRKDLRGRYPKHYWPDDPLQAEPTRRARPRA